MPVQTEDASMFRKLNPEACALVLLATIATPTLADQLPLWEAGAGISVIQFPDYRGSDERQFYALPIPYFVYRGDFLKVDRNKIRGLFFARDWAELDMSVVIGQSRKSRRRNTVCLRCGKVECGAAEDRLGNGA